VKLTLSGIQAKIERHYTLDEPVVVEVPGARYQATKFITLSRTYEYGEVEQEFMIFGQLLKLDGTPDKREQPKYISLYAPFVETLPDPRAVFIDALNDAIS